MIVMKRTTFAIVLALSALASGVADCGADRTADEFAAAVRAAEHHAGPRRAGHAAEASVEA